MKDFTIESSDALRKAFIEELSLRIKFSTIPPVKNRKYITKSIGFPGYVTFCDDKHPDFHFVLPQDWDDAMEFVKDSFKSKAKPKELKITKGNYYWCHTPIDLYNIERGIYKCTQDDTYVTDGDDGDCYDNDNGIVVDGCVDYTSHFREATQDEIFNHLVTKLRNERGLKVGSKVQQPCEIKEGVCWYGSHWDNPAHMGVRTILSFSLKDNELMANVDYDDDGVLIKAFYLTLHEDLTFGGKNVRLLTQTSGVRVECDGETGTLSQMEKIYERATFNKPYKFGSVAVEKVVYSDDSIYNRTNESSHPVTITIGCLTGTWNEFITILQATRELENN